MTDVLANPENDSRSAEEMAAALVAAIEDLVRARLRHEVVDEVAEKVIDAIEGERPEKIPARVAEALDARRARSHRLLVVGQIEYPEAPGTTHVVALGPFSARGVLDSPEKFLKATDGGSAAREAGQGLAWDSKTGKGRGRFMLVPAFATARDAWNYFRGSGGAISEPETWAEIADGASGIEPVCVCGLIKTFACRFCGKDVEHYCQRHEKGTPHHCGA